MATDIDHEVGVREPSLLDALIPLLFMIGLLTLSIVLFGIDAALGPLQVALLMSAVVAAAVAHKNGHTWERLGEEVVKGISLAMSAIMILLMVGALIGVWNMSGTIATIVYYGIKYLNPSWFYLATALITGLVGLVTGAISGPQAAGGGPRFRLGSLLSTKWKKLYPSGYTGAGEKIGIPIGKYHMGKKSVSHTV